MANHAKLTEGQRITLAFAIILVGAGMVFGFVSSFTTLYGAAQAHGWRYPAMLPAGVDVGILAYVLLDHLAVTLGSRSRWLHAVAWALAGFTVWANAVVAPADGRVWRVIHAAMPALWVLGVEALRYIWHRLHADAAARSDAIPAARWIASPLPTLAMWKRMALHNVTSYPVAVAREEARILALDLAADVFGKDWKREAPSLLRHHLKTGTLPGDIARTCDLATAGHMPSVADQVEAWVTGEKVNRAKVVAKVKREERAIDAPLPLPASPAKPRARKRARNTSGERDRKNQMARQLLIDNPGMLRADVAAQAGVSPRTVDRIKSELPTVLRLAAK